MVHTVGVPAQPASLAAMLKAMVAPDTAWLATPMAHRSETVEGGQGAPRSAVVVTVTVCAAVVAGAGAAPTTQAVSTAMMSGTTNAILRLAMDSPPSPSSTAGQPGGIGGSGSEEPPGRSGVGVPVVGDPAPNGVDPIAVRPPPFRGDPIEDGEQLGLEPRVGQAMWPPHDHRRPAHHALGDPRPIVLEQPRRDPLRLAQPASLAIRQRTVSPSA